MPQSYMDFGTSSLINVLIENIILERLVAMNLTNYLIEII